MILLLRTQQIFTLEMLLTECAILSISLTQDCCCLADLFKVTLNFKLIYENHDLAIARSSYSRADPGLRVAFKCLNV